jgi:heat-inducible transcriptional repressor
MTGKIVKNQLNKRELFILQLLVKEYCDTKKPISSKYLKSRYHLDCSSATLRNMFYILERKGFLYKPYTSGGRIPTDSAFRVYVNHLIHINQYIEIELKNLRNELKNRIVDLDNILFIASKLMSKFTNEMSFSFGITINEQRFRSIHFNQIGQSRILTLLFLSSGLVLDRIFYINDIQINHKNLKMTENFINEFIEGKTLSEFKKELGDVINNSKRELTNYSDMASNILMKLKGVISEFESVHIEISSNKKEICNIPLEDRIKNLIARVSKIDNTNVFIGKETGDKKFEDVSIITSPFKINNEITGLFGILGPKTMAYDFNIDFMKNFSKIISNLLTAKFNNWRI